MLSLEQLEISQGAFRLAADMAIEPGARVAVVGPSGAGKSTLLNAIAGFQPIQSGRILWQQTDLSPLPPSDRPVAMLFQDNNLFPHLSVSDNVRLGIRPDLKLSDAEVAQAQNALVRVGLSGLENRKPGALSGGQQSRAALARVLVQNRPIVLLDEPFSALGPALKSEMLDLVTEVLEATGAALLMVTHDPQDARRIAPQTILVAEGIAHHPQATQALLDNPPASLRAYLG